MLYNTRETKTLSHLSGFSQITPKRKWQQKENVQALWDGAIVLFSWISLPFLSIKSRAALRVQETAETLHSKCPELILTTSQAPFKPFV